jgi:poly-gamma-glutamate synthesis protein (capsule biosynthesis protein)
MAATMPPPAEQQRSYAEVTAKATFAATGDLLMHQSVKRSAIAANTRDANNQSTNNEGFDVLFENIAPIIRGADYSFANLETPVAPKNDNGTRSMVFNVSTPLLPSLKDAGFDMVSFANNHVYDQGTKGFEETIDNLTKSPLDFIGAGKDCASARKPHIEEINTISVAFIGATLILNDNENSTDDNLCVNELKVEEAIAAAKEAKEKGAELVVLSVHWGREYQTKPQKDHVDLAHQLMEGGVDLILGHHAHVLQPIEVYETKDHRTAVTVYSLGNLISNQSAWYKYNVHAHEHGNTRDGIILLLDFVRIEYGKSKSGVAMVRTELSNLRAIPTWTLNERHVIEGKKIPFIRVVPTHHLRDNAEASLEKTTDDVEKIRLKRAIELYNTRLNEAVKIIGHGFLAKP